MPRVKSFSTKDLDNPKDQAKKNPQEVSRGDKTSQLLQEDSVKLQPCWKGPGNYCCRYKVNVSQLEVMMEPNSSQQHQTGQEV